MLERVVSWLRGDDLPAIETRAIDQWGTYPPISLQLQAIQGETGTAWHPLSIREAMGVPAVFRAVTLLSNLTGALTIVTYRNGVRVPETPRVVARPDPHRTARDFYRDSVFGLATRGECVWYTTARDVDGDPLALVVVPPQELTIGWESRRLGIRQFEWEGTRLDRRDVTHVTFACEPGQVRGMGPLQLCGAALSVAAEAEEWAANYYASGGVPPVVLVPKRDTTPEKARELQTTWVDRAVPGMPRVAASVDVVPLQVDANNAQLSESRLANRGEVGVMFGIPGHLIEYSPGGSSLTYQNLGAVGDELVRFTLAPGYLEPIEQAMSDLLPRSMIARFDVSGLLRADPMTRANIYRSALGQTGPAWITPDEVRTAEGLDPGSPELAPVPPNLARPRLPAGVDSGS